MNKREFNAAFAIADAPGELGFDGIEIFDGFGLPCFEPVTVTLLMVAKLMRWQARQMSKESPWCAIALNEIREAGRTKFMIADLVDANKKELIC